MKQIPSASVRKAVRVSRDSDRLKAGLKWAVLAIALHCCNCAQAETRVYLLRGWFGVFSTGLDTMAEELRGKGIKAEALGHLSWKSTVAKIVKERAAGDPGRLVLVGHSQGGNNVIDMARELEVHKVPVDLLITLAPFLQDPVPSNVARALNFYQSGGWGSPLTAADGFKGELANIDVGSDLGLFHINIDKSARIQAEVVSAIVALPR
jgi:hypothetical protein